MAYGDGYERRVSPGGTPALPSIDTNVGWFGGLVADVGNTISAEDKRERAVTARSETLASSVEAARARARVDKAADDLQQTPDGMTDYAKKMADTRKRERDAALAGITDKHVLERQTAEWDAYDAGADATAHGVEAVHRANTDIAGLSEQKNIAAGRIARDPSEKTFEDEVMARRVAVQATHASDEVKNKLLAGDMAELAGTQLDSLPPKQARAVLDSGAKDAFLPPDVRRSWSDRIDAKLAREQSQALAADGHAKAIEREAIATDKVSLDAGRADPGAWQALAQRQAAIGDTSGAEASRLRGREIEVSETYRGATPVERDARITALAAKPTLSAAEGAELKGLKGQKTYVDGLGSLDRAAYATGQAVAPLDPTDPASVQRRTITLGAAQQRFGGVADFFLPSEAQAIGDMVHRGTIDQKVEAAGVIARAGRFAGRALDQVGGGDATFRAAATLAPYGEALMRDALSGPEALKANPQMLTPGKDEAGQPLSDRPDAVFAARLGTATAALPGAFAAALKTNAENIYLANARRRGLTNFDPNGYVEAINLALGGTRTPTGWAGGVHLWSGQPVVLPRGMVPQAFEARLSRASGKEWVAAANGVPMSSAGPMFTAELRGLTPVMVRDGVYRLRDGNSFVTTRDGRQFEFDARKLPGIAHGAVAAPAGLTLPRFGAH